MVSLLYAFDVPTSSLSFIALALQSQRVSSWDISFTYCEIIIDTILVLRFVNAVQVDLQTIA
jgi:hypothetical protein